MKICFIADGQAHHAQNWIKRQAAEGHEIHLISTYPIEKEVLPVASLHIVTLDPTANARAKEKDAFMGTTQSTSKTRVISKLRGTPLWKTLVLLRDNMTPKTVQRKSSHVRALVESIAPDLVHAMRIPFEGILAAEALRETPFPLIVSVWGNDFTLFAAKSKTLAELTRRTMKRADGVHPDCRKDMRLAIEWGFSEQKPHLVAPSNGGVDLDHFHLGEKNPSLLQQWGVPDNAFVVLNARGLKSYIRNDVFFQSMPLILKQVPNTFFLATSMENSSFAQEWSARLKLEKVFRALPSVPHRSMGELFRCADIAVSPSDHDGSPNSLLEAMACGAFPVVGNIEPVREWIEDGVNGILFNQKDPVAMADAVLRAIRSPQLCQEAGERNRIIIAERADCQKVQELIGKFYSDVFHAQRLVSV